tara:strand:- start:82 stop:570 length:489 start_codon:yes stop_codon:yes gene_type:complete
MVTQQITAIALRFFAIWLLIQLMLNVPSLIMLITSIGQYQQQEIPMGAYIGIVGALALVGLLAAFLINKAATSVLNKTKSNSEVTLDIESQKLLFQLVGLYFVVNALAYLPRSLSFIPSITEIDITNWLSSAGLTFQLAIGVWLVSSSTFWLKLFSTLRGRA